jgi:hypothetical protein
MGLEALGYYSIPFHPQLHPVYPPVPGDPPFILHVFEDSYLSLEILKPSDYDVKTTGKDLAEHQTNLPTQRHIVLAASHHDEMFNHVLGKYPDGTVCLQVIPCVPPINCEPVVIPHKNFNQLNHEIDIFFLLFVIEQILI